MRNYRKNLANEEGSALLFVLLLLIIMTTMLSTLFLETTLNIKLSGNLASYKKAYYAAEGGLEYGKYLVSSYEGIPDIKRDGREYTPGEVYGEYLLNNESSFTLVFEEDDGGIVIIKSEGRSGGNREIINKELKLASQ